MTDTFLAVMNRPGVWRDPCPSSLKKLPPHGVGIKLGKKQTEQATAILNGQSGRDKKRV